MLVPSAFSRHTSLLPAKPVRCAYGRNNRRTAAYILITGARHLQDKTASHTAYIVKFHRKRISRDAFEIQLRAPLNARAQTRMQMYIRSSDPLIPTNATAMNPDRALTSADQNKQQCQRGTLDVYVALDVRAQPEAFEETFQILGLCFRHSIMPLLTLLS